MTLPEAATSAISSPRPQRAAAEPGGNPFWNVTYQVARKEFLQHIRTKRLLIIVPVFLAVMVFITVIVPTQIIKGGTLSGGFEGGTAEQNIAMLLFFSGFFILSGYFYLQLLPIILTTDAVSSEWESRTLFLLLSKPVPRPAFVLGKFLGSTATVVMVAGLALLLDYGLLSLVLRNPPSAHSVQGFLLGLLIILLGCVAFSAVGLFCSTLTRSTTTGILIALATWIFVFPLLGSLDSLIDIGKRGLTSLATGPETAWSVYLSPSSSMRVASNAIAPVAAGGNELGFLARLFGFAAPGEPAWAIVALLAHTAIFLGLALAVVKRRNFE
ncbi:MAG: ABC transporter permease [Thermoplasmatota archaeon]